MVKRIDFHIHTKPDNDKDTDFTFSQAWLDNYVQKAQLDGIAITNHNLFDLEQFRIIQSNTKCAVYPGIELSLEQGHVNLVFDNDSNTLSELVTVGTKIVDYQLGKTGGLSISEFSQIFTQLRNGIMIFETGKSNSLAIDDRFEASFFSDYTLVRGVNNQLKFLRLKENRSEYCPVLFSDGHATDSDSDETRNDIDKLKLKNTFIQMDNINFSRIKTELSIPDHVGINTELLSKIIQVEIDHKPISISTGLNLIIGRRGSGKTYFLDKIREQYGEDEIFYIKQFASSDATHKYLTQESKSRANSAFSEWQGKYNQQLQAISDHYMNTIQNNVSNYLLEVKRFANQITNSGEVGKVRLFQETSFEEISTSRLEKQIKSLKNLIDAKDFWQVIIHRDERRSVFIDVYNDARQCYITTKKLNNFRDNVNDLLKNIKAVLQKESAVTPPPETQLISQFKYEKERECINKFSDFAVQEQVLNVDHLGGYQICISKCPWNNAEDFKKSFPAPARTSVRNDLIHPYQTKNYDCFFDNLTSSSYASKYSLSSIGDVAKYLVRVDAKLLTESGNKASGGQEVAFGLMMKLSTAKYKNIVLVDEPEASLDNVFIKNELIPKLKELAKNTTVLVITHNSTLGSLLDPDRLIVAKYDEEKNIHQILSGDYTSKMISNELGEAYPSYDDFVDAMEAGIDTYEEKGQHYAALRN